MKILAFALLFFSFAAFAQQGQGFDPERMAGREKQMVLDSITGLSTDQLVLLDVVYENYTTALKAAFGSAQGDREAMMQRMMTIREDKNAMMKDVLSPEQYTKYTEMLNNMRRNWSGQRPQNQN